MNPDTPDAPCSPQPGALLMCGAPWCTCGFRPGDTSGYRYGTEARTELVAHLNASYAALAPSTAPAG